LQELENLYGSLSQRAFSPAGAFAEVGKGELEIKETIRPIEYIENSELGMVAEP
jgi:hypothetical protein